MVRQDVGYDDYKVVLGADSPIKLPGTPGRLRVWIGDPGYKPTFPAEMTTATGALPAVGVTAKVTPIAPAFVIEPKNSVCVTIHPTGSEVTFSLTPKDKGTYDVGAEVLLFNSSDCTGAPIPKATTTLKVTVEVNKAKIREQHVKKFGDVFWENLEKFWGALLALLSALVLFLLRRRLKKLFGFGG